MEYYSDHTVFWERNYGEIIASIRTMRQVSLDDAMSIAHGFALETHRLCLLDRYDPERSSIATFIWQWLRSYLSRRERFKLPPKTCELNENTLVSEMNTSSLAGFRDYISKNNPKPDRYLTVLRLLIEGYKRQEIARMMGTTPNTVCNYVRELKSIYVRFSSK